MSCTCWIRPELGLTPGLIFYRTPEQNLARVDRQKKWDAQNRDSIREYHKERCARPKVKQRQRETDARRKALDPDHSKRRNADYRKKSFGTYVKLLKVS